MAGGGREGVAVGGRVGGGRTMGGKYHRNKMARYRGGAANIKLKHQ